VLSRNLKKIRATKKYHIFFAHRMDLHSYCIPHYVVRFEDERAHCQGADRHDFDPVTRMHIAEHTVDHTLAMLIRRADFDATGALSFHNMFGRDGGGKEYCFVDCALSLMVSVRQVTEDLLPELRQAGDDKTQVGQKIHSNRRELPFVCLEYGPALGFVAFMSQEQHPPLSRESLSQLYVACGENKPLSTLELFLLVGELARQYAQQLDSTSALLRADFFARNGQRVRAALALPQNASLEAGIDLEQLIHETALFDVKPPAALVPRLIGELDMHVLTTMRDLPAPALAAWLHSAVVFVSPRVDFNRRNARLVANYVLCANGLSPLVPVAEYYHAVHADSFSSVGVRSLHQVCYVYTLAHVLRLQESNLCQYCGKHGAVKTCSRCHWARYCCKEHQVEDWPKRHKPLCTSNTTKTFAEVWLARRGELLAASREHNRRMAEARGIELV
jgi:hypothetical protein